MSRSATYTNKVLVPGSYSLADLLRIAAAGSTSSLIPASMCGGPRAVAVGSVNEVVATAFGCFFK